MPVDVQEAQEASKMSSPNLPKLPTLLRRLRVEDDIVFKKRVPYRKLAVKYSVSRRTITEDVKWIKSTLNLPHIQKAVANKVLEALENEEESKVILQYGLPFLAKGIPTQIQSEHTEEITERITIDTTRNEDEVLSEAARILTRKRKSQSIH